MRERKKMRKWITHCLRSVVKKIGGRPSGPAAELVLSLARMRLTIVGVIVMSDMPGLLFSMREGNGGVMPLSCVK